MRTIFMNTERNAIEGGFSTTAVKPATGALAWNPLKWLILSVLPWPKARLQSPPDLLVSQPGVWANDVAALRSALDRAAAEWSHAVWPASEVVGVLSGNEWGTLCAPTFTIIFVSVASESRVDGTAAPWWVQCA